MMPFDPLSVPVTALERKIVAKLRRLDVTDQTQVLLIVGAMQHGFVTDLQVAEALHMGREGLENMAVLCAAAIPEGSLPS